MIAHTNNDRGDATPKIVSRDLKMVLVLCCVFSTALCTAFLLKWQDEIRYPSLDSGSYIELAKQVRAGNYSVLKNPYWSPAYPVFLALFLPSDSSRAPDKGRMLFSEWILLCAVILSFAYFCSELSKTPTHLRPMVSTLVICVGFLFCAAFHIKMYVPTYTPDLIVSAIIFCALGLTCRLSNARTGTGTHVLFGAILAFGYYVKAVLFPASLLLLAFIVLTRWHKRVTLWPTGIAALTFLVLSLPLIGVISTSLGKFSLGETGRLNYGWNVNSYTMHIGWIGDEPNSGTPLHPPRVLSRAPLILEFADPGNGTFPLWYDPAKWHQGMQLQISLRQIVSNFIKQVRSIKGAALLWFVLPFAAVIVSRGAGSQLRKLLWDYGALWLWPILFIASYCLIAAETRYLVPLVVAPVIALIWLWPPTTTLNRVLLAAQFMLLLGGSGWMLYTNLVVNRNSKMYESKWSYETAVESYLRSHGVKTGDTLAIIGTAETIFYAQHLNTQIVSWWRRINPSDVNTPEMWAAAEKIWRQSGVAAALSKCRNKNDAIETVANGTGSCYPEIPASAGFEQIPKTPYFVKILQVR